MFILRQRVKGCVYDVTNGISTAWSLQRQLGALEIRLEARLEEGCGLEKGFHDGSDLEEADEEGDVAVSREPAVSDDNLVPSGSSSGAGVEEAEREYYLSQVIISIALSYSSGSDWTCWGTQYIETPVVLRRAVTVHGPLKHSTSWI